MNDFYINGHRMNIITGCLTMFILTAAFINIIALVIAVILNTFGILPL